MSCSLTTFARMMAALTIVFASLVFVPVGDAVACSSESAALQAFDSVDAPNDAADQSTEKSALCSHGHCHHAATDRPHMAEVTPPYPHDLVVRVARERVDVTAAPDGLMRPPRA